ncbi:MAG: cytochrome-c peroxidase [Planctomycetes bacterium RIFCSPHIGHO2_02_FULL_52_58]|nr:MAG: cytochrome-c peroxidase [Planctomycetes bacterium RIFCSPHIGHO2_02_FULL_52_58]
MKLLLFVSLIFWSFFSAHAEEVYEIKGPLGLPDLETPDDNPQTPEKVALGRKLYFDTRLSADDTISCATCHDPTKGFADGEPVSTGIKGQKGGRNAPSVLNAAYYRIQFWDGRAPSLEEQAKGPIVNPIEMGMPSHQAVVEKLRGIRGYQEAFQKVFGKEGITIDNIAIAIASFERTILAGNSPFDRYFFKGDKDAMSQSAIRGMEVFKEKGKCTLCHPFTPDKALFTDNGFHNIGVGMDKPNPDLGRYSVVEGAGKTEGLRGAFKTPTLRNVTLTAPYMHDGSQKTLEEAVDFYDKGGHPNPYLDPQIKPLNLTGQEKSDLVEFMKSLTCDTLPSLTGVRD